jgi:hypothetical protein
MISKCFLFYSFVHENSLNVLKVYKIRMPCYDSLFFIYVSFALLLSNQDFVSSHSMCIFIIGLSFFYKVKKLVAHYSFIRKIHTEASSYLWLIIIFIFMVYIVAAMR